MADPDEMRMQALVIRERILGPAHPDTSYYIRYRGAVYVGRGCIDLWNYALDMQQTMLERLNPMTQSSLFSFTELFSFMMGEEGKHTTRGRLVPPIDVMEILRVFNKAVREVELGSLMLERMPNMERDMTHLTRVMVITLHLACLLTRLLDHHTSTDAITEDIHRAIYNLVNALRTNGSPPRLLQGRRPLGEVPGVSVSSPHLAEVLLKVGADPNLKDDDGNTPLHLAAMANPARRTYGAHIDLVNNTGDTFASLLKGQQVHELVNTAKYTTSCAAARVIQQFKIPYRGIVPAALESVIACH
ncbi:hypothetical protein NQ317_008457 [Molorchus minor]|uniref:Uncharacterized protein n=1 Tax=Molorchus minor TaxID=1323400 RepID=A0ABQ9J1U7_9CUCU|nr:hypothetical protein NQ317_008457 [Molorchus minor]